MSDVVVQTHRPEAVLQAAELKRAAVPGQGKALRRLGVGASQDRAETGTEGKRDPNIDGHRTSPSRSSVVTQFSQSRRPREFLPRFPFTSTTRLLENRGYNRKSGFFKPSSPTIARLASSIATQGTRSP